MTPAPTILGTTLQYKMLGLRETINSVNYWWVRPKRKNGCYSESCCWKMKKFII